MPVYKFRTVEDMRRAQRLAPDHPSLPRVIRLVWARGWEMGGCFQSPRGVFKFRTIEEANAHRKKWEQERIERLRAVRDTKQR